jgi:hypothetical protein
VVYTVKKITVALDEYPDLSGNKSGSIRMLVHP